MLVRFLTHLGYVVDEAMDGVEAVEMVHLAMFGRPFRQVEGEGESGSAPSSGRLVSIPHGGSINMLGTRRNTTRSYRGAHQMGSVGMGMGMGMGERPVNYQPYECILMDHEMPIMEGPTAIKMIREFGYEGIIYGVTGNGCTSDLEKFTNAGANTVFVKPLDLAAFKARFQHDEDNAGAT